MPCTRTLATATAAAYLTVCVHGMAAACVARYAGPAPVLYALDKDAATYMFSVPGMLPGAIDVASVETESPQATTSHTVDSRSTSTFIATITVKPEHPLEPSRAVVLRVDSSGELAAPVLVTPPDTFINARPGDDPLLFEASYTLGPLQCCCTNCTGTGESCASPCLTHPGVGPVLQPHPTVGWYEMRMFYVFNGQESPSTTFSWLVLDETTGTLLPKPSIAVYRIAASAAYDDTALTVKPNVEHGYLGVPGWRLECRVSMDVDGGSAPWTSCGATAPSLPAHARRYSTGWLDTGKHYFSARQVVGYAPNRIASATVMHSWTISPPSFEHTDARLARLLFTDGCVRVCG